MHYLFAEHHRSKGEATIGAPGGNRTPNNGSEDRSYIHLTTGALRNF